MCIGVCVVNCLAYYTSHVKCELRDLCDIWGLTWFGWLWFDIGKVMIFVIQKNLMMVIGGILWFCWLKDFMISTSSWFWCLMSIHHFDIELRVWKFYDCFDFRKNKFLWFCHLLMNIGYFMILLSILAIEKFYDFDIELWI